MISCTVDLKMVTIIKALVTKKLLNDLNVS